MTRLKSRSTSSSPRSSIRYADQKYNLSYGTVQKLLKKSKLHAYKVDFDQYLRAEDITRRLEFIAWFNIQFHDK